MPETPLERLLIDASLGETKPDWKWLLEQYLSEHPEHRRQAEEIRATANLAKRTLTAAEPCRVSLPPMPDFEHVGQGSFIRSLLWPAFAAVCLLIGWTFGNLQGRELPGVPVAVTLQPALQAVTPAQLTFGEGARPSSDFWSEQRWAKRFQRNRDVQPRSPMIEWQAPFVPKITGRTEQET